MLSNKKKSKYSFLFNARNYVILIISVLLVCFGFFLMIGGGGETATDFNEEIFSPRRIQIAPIVIIVGYIGMIASIFYNDRIN